MSVVSPDLVSKELLDLLELEVPLVLLEVEDLAVIRMSAPPTMAAVTIIVSTPMTATSAPATWDTKSSMTYHWTAQVPV